MKANTLTEKDLPVVVVGAGFSGTLLAINLLRQGGRVVLVERKQAQLAKGLAFGTRSREHLLNVRASNMSAFPDDPGHFLRWMGFATADQANRFVPRLTYGHYLREQLLAALAAAPDRGRVCEREAVRARWPSEDRVEVELAGGERIMARALVLAQGNFPPRPLPALADLPEGLYATDPWGETTLKDAGKLEHVLLLGTGLTAVDMALSLEAAGFTGRITALSRRGLSPRAHALSGPQVAHVPRPTARGSWLLRHLRQRLAVVDWRQAVDELRPHTQSLWRLHDRAAQARFLRHLRPWWDVHRHRLAPPVAERIAALEAAGRLRFVAGRLQRARAVEGRAELTWRPRGQACEETLQVDRIINCIGPEGDITRSADPLLQRLLAEGRVAPDGHRLGLNVDHTSRAIDPLGCRQERLYAVGPMTKGEAWEIVAVPDIRRQVWDLARLLTHSHWVGGEGL